MKKMKKILAMLLAAVMVMGMSVTALAEDVSEDKTSITGKPSENDKVNVTIGNLFKEENGQLTTTADKVSVTLYQIARAEYDADGSGFIRYRWNDGVTGFTKDTEVKFPTKEEGEGENKTIVTVPLEASDIIKIANNLPQGLIVENQKAISVTTGKYEAEVSAGIYIAMITGSDNGYVYNPVLLTATYSAEAGNVNLVGGAISINSAHYLNGTTAVAKRSTPSIDKKIESGVETDDTITGNTLPEGTDMASNPTTNATASVGDLVKFSITPKIPSYPKDAVNKKLAVSDRMAKGLTLEFSTLQVYLDSTDTAGKLTRSGLTDGIYTFSLNNKPVAYAKEAATTEGEVTTNGFNVTFVYDNLIKDETTGATYQPIIQYKARINDKAVVGQDGNTNTTILHYTNQPNTSSDYDPATGDLPTGEDVKEKKDRETIYTYQIAIHKIGEGEADKNGLKDAIFGIYSDASCETLIDMVKTNETGYAVSKQVKEGDYYIKEIEAPNGYSLSDKTYKVTANWTSATTTVTGTVTRTEYTADQNEARNPKVQVGWLTHDDTNKFYALDKKEELDTEGINVIPAYVKTESTVEESTTITTSNPGSGTASTIKEVTVNNGVVTAEKDATDIPNTKLASLPSTGGIGTTIFTIGGCAIMIAAAALFFATRRKNEK